MTNYLELLQARADAQRARRKGLDARAEDLAHLHFDKKMTLQAIGEAQDPPISRQAVHQVLKGYLKRNTPKIFTPPPTQPTDSVVE